VSGRERSLIPNRVKKHIPQSNIDEKLKNLSDCFLGTELRAPRRVIANPEGAPMHKPRLLALSAADRACLTHGA
jgi:hypothetical protein